MLREYVFLRSAQVLLVPALSALFVLLIVGVFFLSEYDKEKHYQEYYGKDWVTVYEQKEGSLAGVHQKMLAGAIVSGVAVVLAFAIYGMMRPPGPINGGRRPRRRR